jgi:hypothetical protein
MWMQTCPVKLQSMEGRYEAESIEWYSNLDALDSAELVA